VRSFGPHKQFTGLQLPTLGDVLAREIVVRSACRRAVDEFTLQQLRHGDR
jgi:hypothetical protein